MTKKFNTSKRNEYTIIIYKGDKTTMNNVNDMTMAIITKQQEEIERLQKIVKLQEQMITILEEIVENKSTK